MSKVFKTKTGRQLTLIQGGLSEAVDLDLQVPEFDEYSKKLMSQFGNARISLRQDFYRPDSFELTVEFKVDAETWTKSKDRHSILGGLTVDLSNYLSRFHGLSQYAVPTVDSKQRSKNGQKSLTFVYQVSDLTAYSMGLDQDETFKMIQRGA